MRALLIAILLMFGSQVWAKVIVCSLENHKAMGNFVGGPGMKELLYDRLGTQIRLDTSQNTISNFRRNRWQRPVQIEETKKNKNFTSYVWRLRGRFKTEQDKVKGRAPTGSHYTITNSFRIDINNYGKLIMKQSGNFVPLEAKGKCGQALDRLQQPNARARKVNITEEIQRELNRLGCKVGSADGAIGPASRRGLKQFAKANKTFSYDVSVFSNPDFLTLLKGKRSGFCNR